MSIKVKRFRAQPVTRLLGGRGELSGLMRMASLLERAQTTLRDALPEELREHLYVGGYRDGRLTLITDRAAWLTRLRYEQPRLLTLLRGLPEFAALQRLDLKVRPVRPPKPVPRQERHLPARAAAELASCASEIDDPRLRGALERLAAHGAKPADDTDA
ncbi:DUF721 domain-containing protein [Halomonas sp. 328]|uniref:DUF721 domain-containing protein n=1 Tax=Halomonas sp. 328 TaxID=2776704 RepID=UPI0018A75869|nr:DUF721 domain-containing protein [Halomonas sp. 328]MBF8224056.1 DUF721 domain-containing protein [Halomonas sp. 328]